MTEEEAHVIVEAVAALPTGKQVAFVLGMLEKVQEERDRLRAELRRQALQTISDEDQYDENYRIRLAAEAGRDRLRAVVDVADDFWPLIESIYDSAVASW